MSKMGFHDTSQNLSAIIPPEISSEFEQIFVDGAIRSAVNSDGKRLHASDDYIRNFWRWFDGSVMVDEHNRPRPHYHTTPSARLNDDPFDEFDPGVNYFSDKPDEQYGDFAMQVYLRIKNPYQAFDKKTGAYVYSDGSMAVENSGYDNEEDKEYITVGFLKENPSVVEDMMARGFDGSVDSGAFVVVFDNDQVVSAISNHPDFLPSDIPTVSVDDRSLPRIKVLYDMTAKEGVVPSRQLDGTLQFSARLRSIAREIDGDIPAQSPSMG